ncbi:MAG: phage holin family protein [Patescibacteria group bacterium]
MGLLLKILLNAGVVFLASYLLSGVEVDGFVAAIAVAIVLGILNAVIKPILVILTLPITIVTLGLFTLVINTALVALTAWLVPGFEVLSFWWALGFSLVVSVISWFLSSVK